MTVATAQVLEAWSEVFSSPVITELAPGRVWEVATERRHRYVLKKVSTFSAPDPVRRFTDEARILTYLLQRGVPVAVPVLSNDGKACTTCGDGAPYAVFPMLPQGGDNDPKLDPDLLENMGAAIARLHAALADCPFGIGSWEIGPGLLTASWQTVQDRLPADMLTGLSARIRPRWDSIVQALSAAPQRVHGDVHGGNILTDGQEVTGIIDCDHLPLAPRGYDLGYYMAFGVQWRLAASQPSPPVDEVMPIIARHLLTGYAAVSRLTRQQNDDLPALALAAALALLAFFIQEHDQVEESWLRTACWISDHCDALRLHASAFDGHEDLAGGRENRVGAGPIVRSGEADGEGLQAGSRLAELVATRTSSPAGITTSPMGRSSVVNEGVAWFTGFVNRSSSSTAAGSSDGSSRTRLPVA